MVGTQRLTIPMINFIRWGWRSAAGRWVSQAALRVLISCLLTYNLHVMR